MQLRNTSNKSDRNLLWSCERIVRESFLMLSYLKRHQAWDPDMTCTLREKINAASTIHCLFDTELHSPARAGLQLGEDLGSRLQSRNNQLPQTGTCSAATRHTASLHKQGFINAHS